MGRRTLLLIAALVVAALGTVLVFLYANNARNEGLASQELVQVLVAKSDDRGRAPPVPPPRPPAPSSSRRSRGPTSSPGALSDATPLADLVAIAPIFAGQQIIAAQWGTTGQTTGLSIPDGQDRALGPARRPRARRRLRRPRLDRGDLRDRRPEGRRRCSRNVPVIGVGPSGSVPATAADGTANGNVEQIPTRHPHARGHAGGGARRSSTPQGKANPATYTGLYFALMNAESKVVAGRPGRRRANLFR